MFAIKRQSEVIERNPVADNLTLEENGQDQDISQLKLLPKKTEYSRNETHQKNQSKSKRSDKKLADTIGESKFAQKSKKQDKFKLGWMSNAKNSANSSRASSRLQMSAMSKSMLPIDKSKKSRKSLFSGIKNMLQSKAKRSAVKREDMMRIRDELQSMDKTKPIPKQRFEYRPTAIVKMYDKDEWDWKSKNQFKLLNHIEKQRRQEQKEKNKNLVLLTKEKEATCIFLQNSKWRMRWDLLIIFLAVYNCFLVPHQISFGKDFFSEETLQILNIIEWIVDAMFLCDILANFRTSFVSPRTGVEETNPKAIAFNYVSFRGTFWLDLLSTIPFDKLFQMQSVNKLSNTTVQLLQILKLTRLLRLRKIVTFMKIQQNYKFGIRIMQILLLLIIVIHWIGCLWYIIIIADAGIVDDVTGESYYWALPILSDQQEEALFFQSTSLGKQYLIVIYYSILMVVGNEIQPKTPRQTIYCSLVVVVASLMLSFVFSNILEVIRSQQNKVSRMSQLIDYVRQCMISIELPLAIQNDVYKYLEQLEQQPEVQQDMGKVLSYLSPALRAEVQNYLHFDMIKHIPQLREATQVEILFIVNAMKSYLALPGDVVIRQGGMGSEMFFILNGSLQVSIEAYRSKHWTFVKPKTEQSDSEMSEQDTTLKSQQTKKSTKRGGFIQKQGQFFNNIKKEELEQDEDDDHQDDKITVNRRRAKEQDTTHSRLLDVLQKGEFFGEIALFTKLTRTTTVTALTFSVFSTLSKETVKEMKKAFPQVYQNFQKTIAKYTDEDMELRKSFLQNIPYLKDMPLQIIMQIVYKLREETYEENTQIIKQGDMSDRLYIVWLGQIQVEVQKRNVIEQNPLGETIKIPGGGGFIDPKPETQIIQFDLLKPGAVFSAYAPFAKDGQLAQLVTFRVASPKVILLSVTADKLQELSKHHLDFAFRLKQVEAQIKNNFISSLDFFHPPVNNRHFTQKMLMRCRFKARLAVLNFYNKFKQGRASLPPAIVALNQIRAEVKEAKTRVLKIMEEGIGLPAAPYVEDFYFKTLITEEEKSLTSESEYTDVTSELTESNLLSLEDEMKGCTGSEGCGSANYSVYSSESLETQDPEFTAADMAATNNILSNYLSDKATKQFLSQQEEALANSDERVRAGLPFSKDNFMKLDEEQQKAFFDTFDLDQLDKVIEHVLPAGSSIAYLYDQHTMDYFKTMQAKLKQVQKCKKFMQKVRDQIDLQTIEFIKLRHQQLDSNYMQGLSLKAAQMIRKHTDLKDEEFNMIKQGHRFEGDPNFQDPLRSYTTVSSSSEDFAIDAQNVLDSAIFVQEQSTISILNGSKEGSGEIEIQESKNSRLSNGNWADCESNLVSLDFEVKSKPKIAFEPDSNAQSVQLKVDDSSVRMMDQDESRVSIQDQKSLVSEVPGAHKTLTGDPILDIKIPQMSSEKNTRKRRRTIKKGKNFKAWINKEKNKASTFELTGLQKTVPEIQQKDEESDTSDSVQKQKEGTLKLKSTFAPVVAEDVKSEKQTKSHVEYARLDSEPASPKEKKRPFSVDRDEIRRRKTVIIQKKQDLIANLELLEQMRVETIRPAKKAKQIAQMAEQLRMKRVRSETRDPSKTTTDNGKAIPKGDCSDIQQVL